MKTIIVERDSEAIDDNESIVDSDELLQRAMVVLQREVKNLLAASAKNKLESGPAKDLVQYIGLLTDIEAKKINQLSQMSDEEIAALAKADVKERNRERMRVNKLGKKNEDKRTGGTEGTNSPSTSQEE